MTLVVNLIVLLALLTCCAILLRHGLWFVVDAWRDLIEDSRKVWRFLRGRRDPRVKKLRDGSGNGRDAVLSSKSAPKMVRSPVDGKFVRKAPPKLDDPHDPEELARIEAEIEKELERDRR